MFKAFPIWFIVVWLTGILLSLGTAAVVIWAIIKLVTHFTA